MAFVLLTSLITVGPQLGLSLWTDRDDGVYHQGDLLTVYFTVEQACYVTVYNVEQGGEATLLFPPEGDDGWVEAGETHRLPPEDADYDYRISGPEGVETIVAFASQEMLPLMDVDDPDIISASVDISIKESEPAELTLVSVPRSSRIYLTETRSGAREYVGETPRTIVLKPGEYVIEIKKAGFRTLKRSVDLSPGEKRKVFVRL